MSATKRYLEDISEAIGFNGELNSRVEATFTLLNNLFNSEAVASDFEQSDKSAIAVAVYDCRLMSYAKYPDAHNTVLVRLLESYSFEELFEYYQHCVYKFIKDAPTRLAWISIGERRFRGLVHKVSTTTIEFSPAGGGFVQTIDRKLARLEYVDKFTPNYVAGFFQIDDGVIYEGFHDPDARWNGWAMPYFTREVANLVASEIPQLEDKSPYAYFEGDTCYVWDYGLEEYEAYEPTTLEGVDELVYGIGAGSWIWDNASDSEYEYQKSGFEGSYDEFLEDRRGF